MAYFLHNFDQHPSGFDIPWKLNPALPNIFFISPSEKQIPLVVYSVTVLYLRLTLTDFTPFIFFNVFLRPITQKGHAKPCTLKTYLPAFGFSMSNSLLIANTGNTSRENESINNKKHFSITSSSSCHSTPFVFLFRRAINWSIRTKHTTISWLWFKQHLTVCALVKIQTGIGWHFFWFVKMTHRALDDRINVDILIQISLLCEGRAELSANPSSSTKNWHGHTATIAYYPRQILYFRKKLEELRQVNVHICIQWHG